MKYTYERLKNLEDWVVNEIREKDITLGPKGKVFIGQLLCNIQNIQMFEETQEEKCPYLESLKEIEEPAAFGMSEEELAYYKQKCRNTPSSDEDLKNFGVQIKKELKTKRSKKSQ
jgi:hypothetical protein